MDSEWASILDPEYIYHRCIQNSRFRMLHEKRIGDSDHSLNLAIGPDNGPSLLMLHGVTRRWQTFTPLLPTLASRWQLLALDFRGHGESESTCDGYHVIDYERDVSIAIPHFPSDRFVLYGHSLGGMVAALTAARHPAVAQHGNRVSRVSTRRHDIDQNTCRSKQL